MRNTSILPSYRETLEHLDTFNNLERSMPSATFFRNGGERMRRLLKRVGQPHLGVPALHLAGTKGKGSASHLAEAAIRVAGFKTGTYTSPHVLDLRERIAVTGIPIGVGAFAEAASEVLGEAEAMRREGQAPSYFETLTVIALAAFRNAKVEAIILEAGLGGRLDATNIPDLRVVAAGITAISKDHEDLLGHSLVEIAAEKAEIIRPGAPVVSAPQTEAVAKLVAEKAGGLQSPLFTVGKEIKVEASREPIPDKPLLGQRLNLETRRGFYNDITLTMLGRHQAENAGLALGLADLFLEYMDREPLDPLILKRAWRGLTLPARLETVAQSPWRIVDGAHNPASAWFAAETLVKCFTATDRTLVFGVASDKDWRTMLRIFAPLFRNVVLTAYDSPRAAPTQLMAEFLSREFSGVKATEAMNPAHA
ncbi:MAG: hypothetical protein LBV15_04795, partial [Planctomycetota bacterium]|nr:hypothetical protein [Planctomycetota bacterium]